MGGTTKHSSGISALEERYALSDLIRRHAQHLVSLSPGEEEAAFDAALAELADLVGAHVASRWDVGGTLKVPTRHSRWVRPGAAETALVVTVEPDSRVHRLWETVVEPVIVDDLETYAAEGLVTDGPIMKKMTRLLVPARSGSSLMTLLVMSRPSSEPWRDWEQDLIADFAALIPAVREQLDARAAGAASFRDAPVAMTLRADSGELLEWNQAFVDFLGLGADKDLAGGRLVDLVDADLMSEVALEALDRRHFASTEGFEVAFRHSSGRTVWGRLARAPIAKHNGYSLLTHIEDVTMARERRTKTHERATRDELTGLANRHEIFDVLNDFLSPLASRNHLVSGSHACAVVMIDLNHFKQVNDTFGHAAGDMVLTTVGERLRSLFRSSDLVGRYGGDEFVVIMAGPVDPELVQKRTMTARELLRQSVKFEGNDLDLAASAGFALGHPGDDPKVVIAQADDAMYIDKQTGRNLSV